MYYEFMYFTDTMCYIFYIYTLLYPLSPHGYLPPCQSLSSTTVMSSCAYRSLTELQPDHLSDAALQSG